MKHPIAIVAHRGFTLIELLVVISIIALLVAILLPSLARARDAAISLQCRRNIRQFFHAVEMYAEDTEGFYPIASRAPGNAKYHSALWSGVVAHYLGFTYFTEHLFNEFAWSGYREPVGLGLASSLRDNMARTLLKCPADDFKTPWGKNTVVTYGWNGGKNGYGAHDRYGDENINSDATVFEYARQKRLRIARPTTIMLGEWAKDDGTKYYEYRGYFQMDRPTELSDNLHAHVGNVLWGDGHATGETQESLNVDENNDGLWDYFNRYE